MGDCCCCCIAAVVVVVVTTLSSTLISPTYLLSSPQIYAGRTPRHDCRQPLSEINSRHVALSVGEVGGGQSGRIISCGYWDNALKVHTLDSHKEIASVTNGHLGEITCVQLGYQGSHTLITGGADGTVSCRALRLNFLMLLYVDISSNPPSNTPSNSSSQHFNKHSQHTH